MSPSLSPSKKAYKFKIQWGDLSESRVMIYSDRLESTYAHMSEYDGAVCTVVPTVHGKQAQNRNKVDGISI
jgi:hypothetical protein